MDSNANDPGGMDPDSDLLKILSTTSTTVKSVSKSELLTSGLTGHVMAEQVMGFLDTESVLSCLEVEDLCKHFDLKSYYCSIHGTKLESQVERRRDLESMTGNDDDQGEDADQICNNDNVAAAEVNIECEDCVEAEFDRERCTCCKGFENADELNQCNNCSYQECDPCYEDTSMICCSSCEEVFCGREGCEKIEHCDCGEGFCSMYQEDNIQACLQCGSGGCLDCFYEDGFCCDKCDSAFCIDCDNYGHCDSCEQIFCSTCMETRDCEFFCCNNCGRTFCNDCDPYSNCARCEEQFCSTCMETWYYEGSCCHAGIFCMDCVSEHWFCCNKCDKAFCTNSDDYGYCDKCDEKFCSTCNETWYCAGCEHGSCYSCDQPVKCKTCNQQHGCSECSDKECFCCGGCSKTYCREKCKEFTTCDICFEDVCEECDNGRICKPCLKWLLRGEVPVH
ncbi:proprotein convertase subtilisin kexin type [Seminavis robusta]|uniref:Proprotein convertase subtilisin kexin type n=1 Tax=Seminavis robusta TaxID=568900 RepID=A0A9N8ENK3_9STRA|nr:proprotein convertase subtilisin kexin type [Seminavis robusta]|eukprot:Sro1322_g262570.1 proprotein convertase subtilisin kexin type (449) ;mRNA; r:9165-10511